MDTASNLRDAVLDHALRAAPFDGWTDRTLRDAVRAAGLPEGGGELYFPRGALDLLAHWHERSLEHVEREIAERGLSNPQSNMGVRDRVREGVLIAVEAVGPHEAAMRRATARLSLPDAGAQAPRQLWEMADAIWHGIGDTSTDFNYYTKRTILAGVLGSTVVAWVNDTSPDKRDARAHLDRRLEGVMQFERIKARARTLTDRLPDPARLLGTLRYGRGGGFGARAETPPGPGTGSSAGGFNLGPFAGGMFGKPSTLRRRRRSR